MKASQDEKIYLPLKTASLLLSQSVATLRKSIKNGDLKGIKTNVGYLLEVMQKDFSEEIIEWVQASKSLDPDDIQGAPEKVHKGKTKKKTGFEEQAHPEADHLPEANGSPPVESKDAWGTFITKPNQNVLVVDDQKFSRQIIGDFVKDFQYKPFFAENGREALEFLSTKHVSIVLSDLEMPEMNGMELLENIKALNLQTDVVIITGNASIESAIEAMKKGAVDYLLKPVQSDALDMILTRCSRRQRLEYERHQLQVTSRNLELENLELKKFLQFFERSREITSEIELQRLLDMIVEFATVQTNALKGSLFLLDEKKGELILKSYKGIDPKGIRNIKIGEGFLGKVAQKGEPVLLSPPKPTRKRKNGTGQMRTIPSCIYLPLKMKTKTIGILCVFDKVDGNVFNKFDQLLLILLAEQAVVAIRNARLYKSVEVKSIKDPRTNLYSPYFFVEYLSREIERYKTIATPFSVSMFAFNHVENGQAQLTKKQWVRLKKQLSTIAQETLRKSDILAYWKRNRFAILLTNIDHAEVVSVVERFKLKLEQDILINQVLGDHKASIALSFVMKEDIAQLDPQNFVYEALDRCNKELQLALTQT